MNSWNVDEDDDDNFDDLILKAREVRASLPVASEGMYWHGEVYVDRRAASWGYWDESVSVGIFWGLRREGI